MRKLSYEQMRHALTKTRDKKYETEQQRYEAMVKMLDATVSLLLQKLAEHE